MTPRTLPGSRGRGNVSPQTVVTARPADEDLDDAIEPERPTIEDPNDLDTLRDLWQDRGFVTPSSGGWIGPDD